MADDLSYGVVPAYYREVYDIVCPNPRDGKVDQDMFVKILVKSSLPKQTLSSIWEAADSKQGYLTRNGLYKALALTALAQQGKPISEKILENYGKEELPKPHLGDLSDLRTLSAQVRREKNPNVLNFSYKDLVELDSISINLVPEKKGLLLKHVEYEIKSEYLKSCVMRRYSDFDSLYDMLTSRYPYRMVPRLPPKKMLGANREFIEGRRKALVRFMTLVVRHPVFHGSDIIRYFLTYQGSDIQHRIKEQFRSVPDEYVTSPLALTAKDLVPMDTQIQYGNAREHIKKLFNSVNQLKCIVDQMTIRSTASASDMLMMAKELNTLGSETQIASTWAMGINESWPKIKTGLKAISVEFAALSDKHATQGKREDNNVAERLALILDLLQSYKDLCDRHEKGVLKDHQSALAKMGNIKKKKMSATIRGSEHVGEVEQLESRIIEQESQIMTMENRNYFSLHCIQMETQLVHANIDILAEVVQALAKTELQGHKELFELWEKIEPQVETLRATGDGDLPSSPTTPTSPGLLSSGSF
ncbi:sorting nexin-8-like isoform X1 [Asterias rubens]|uniref:sorting nexin-8-like isoform X1 n=1 Tax=Asterias rubens TaxID=7604 RepID=UPI001455197A|nr:sorting nexin-8-like isoform X1 [Asterias rubens]